MLITLSSNFLYSQDESLFRVDESLFDGDTVRQTRLRFLKAPDIKRLDPGYRFDNKRIPPGYERNYAIDTAKGTYHFSEQIEGIDITPEYEIGLNEYLLKRKEQIQEQTWDSLITRYDIKKALSGGDLARLMAQSTGLTIPLPPNPLMGIFGKPEISINVNGEVNLRVGWRWDSQNLGTVSAFGQTQSSPLFHQDIRVQVNGRIGDKLKLNTDWNTRRTFDYDNKFKVGYEGYDDDIIKLVEVGNVSLPLNSSLIGGGQALFGVRADFQFGPLFLKTLFSQRRGQRKFVDVRGGVSKQQFSIRAYDWSKNHFFLDLSYKDVYKEYFQYSTPVTPSSRLADSLRIGRIEVWEAQVDQKNPHQSASVAIADLRGVRREMDENYGPAEKNATIETGRVARGNFIRLDSMRYDVDYNLGTLTIENLRPDRYYAVSYKIEGATDDNIDDVYFGTFANEIGRGDTLLLKLVYHPNMQPGFGVLWDRQMKNIYSINASNVNINETSVNLWYIRQSNDSTDVLEGAPDKLVTIFGVDQVNNSTGNAPPDGVFDLKPPFFNPITGEITFPHPEPFDSLLIEYFTELGNPELANQYRFPDVYDTTYDIAARNTSRDRFVISGEVSGRQTNRISLGSFNLSPGSVRVTLDGVPLREFEDYIVDYYSGTLTLRNPRATLPNANLKIEYEQQDIFNISTRTLMGLRADYNILKSRHANAGLGMTLMHYDQSALIDRVRLGEEPVSNTMLGFDGTFNWDTPWLTKLIDLLPFYDTKAKSSITARAEWALMLPNPNKRTSEISSDQGESVVYIDDFEGAQRYISLGLNATQWQHSSQPTDTTLWPNAEDASLYRGKLFWYQYFIPRVRLRDVYPNNKTYQTGNQNINPLEITFDPDRRGIYNRNFEYLEEDHPGYQEGSPVFSQQPENRRKIWGGMMRLFSAFNTNFDTENIEFVEIMLKINQWEPGNTKMFVDIGQISEDIIPNNSLDTEDGITEDNTYPNNIIDAGEDRGIDAILDNVEKETYPEPLNLEDDPARDNYAFDFYKDDRERDENDFVNYNNFEGNSTISELGQFPDTEILNKSNGQSISLANDYFVYEINLEPDPNINTQIVGGNPDKGWFLYRIPIRKPSYRVGNPLFSHIQYVRVRFQGGIFRGQIADWRLVGSQWQRISNFQNVPPDDSVLSLAFVNLWENAGPPDFYEMPPGVSAPRQLNNPDPTQDIRMNEQSLAISVKNLKPSEERMATRIFRPLDLFFYKKLKFFIHGDGTMPGSVMPGAKPQAYAFVRFGIDSSNYYEYRRPLIRGWQDISIDLAKLTSIKQIRDTSNLFERQIIGIEGDDLGYFAIKGSPILTRVQFFGFGIANESENFQELEATMWVNELRLVEAEDGADWAGVASVDMQLADIGSINASFRNSQPNFHSLEERFGNRKTTTDWSVSMQGNLDKFAPKSFQSMKLPINYTHTEFMEDPEFVANSDVNIEEAANAAYRQAYDRAIDNGASPDEADRIGDLAREEILMSSQTMKVQDSWAMTGVKLGLPIKNWLIDDTFNKITIGYSYSQEYERSYLYEKRFNWMWRLTLEYSVPISELLTLKPLGWAENVPILGTYSGLKLNFLPNNFSAGLNMTRRRQTEKSRYLDFASPVIRDFTANRTAQIQWKLSEGGFLNPAFDYTMNSYSTLVPFEFDENGMQRTGSEIANAIFFNDGQLIDFGKNTQHTQTVNINLQPRIPDVGGINNYLDITGSFNTTYNWQDPLQPDPRIRDVAKNASWNNSIRFNAGLRLKSMADNWFGVQPPPRRPGMGRGRQAEPDTAKSAESKSFTESLGLGLKTIFLDWEKLDFIFNQTNSSMNPGVFGGNGLTNFWGRGMTFRESQNTYGPSFAYQLGLISNPHGGFNFVPSGSFPWFAFDSYTGLRPPNAVMQDNYSQQTTFEIKTTRQLWEGADLDLNWSTSLGYSRDQTVVTDEFGVPTFKNIIAMENLNRTFIMMPTIFGFNVFNNTIDNVVNIFEDRSTEVDSLNEVQYNRDLQRTLSGAFYDGLEAFSIFGGSAGRFLPAINWAIRWEGLEEWELWQGLIKRMSVEHSYVSTYQENVEITDDGRSVQSQMAQYGFQPFVGVTATFDDDKLDGNLTANFRIATQSSFTLNSAARSTISRQSTTEITGQAAYTMKGFEFPLFGLILENDFELSFMATYKNNDRATYDLLNRDTFNNNEGQTLDGNTQIILEPRARYSMSNRVTASFFVRYEGTFTEGAAQPGFHTTQVGLDIRISIAGGR